MAVSVAHVADAMAIPASTTLYTQAMSMQGANAALVTFMIFTLGGASSITPTLEGSNDMVNWTTITAYSAITSSGYQVASTTSTAIAWQYVRLKLAAASGGTVILSADVSTALL